MSHSGTPEWSQKSLLSHASADQQQHGNVQANFPRTGGQADIILPPSSPISHHLGENMAPAVLSIILTFHT